MKPERSTNPPAATEPAAEPTTLSGELLDRVIQETLAAGAAEACADSWAGLLEVARCYPQPLLTVDPVLIAMVKSILGKRFRKALRDGDAWDQMASSIATTLFDDAAARERLNSLWARLREVCGE